MATWKTENSLLTLKGVEILNKLNLGQGQITISRIVAGSGRVAESALYKQTEIGGTQKNLVINNYRTEDLGTELSFHLSNEGFTESFTVNQIGVYVTHPDYVGEVLYHISQCDSAGADLVPAYTGNAVTLTYSLYLVHGNASAITISIDPVGMVTKESFDAFKSSTESELSSIKGSVKDISDSFNSFKSTTNGSITTINTSLSALTNAYNSFKAGISKGKLVGVDDKGNLIASGKIIVSGSSFEVTDAITHRALSLSVEGKSTQSPTPTVSAPVYLANTKVVYIRNAKGNSSKLISFPSTIELRSLEDYKDTIEWDGAKWWKVQRIQEVVLDGTTNGVYYDGNSSKTYCRYAITSGTLYKQIKDHITTAPIVTSHGNTVGETSELYAFHYSSNGGIVGHFLNTVTGVNPDVQTTMQTKCAKINEWLKAQKDAGTPVKVWYVLKTPIVTEISLTEVLDMYADSTSISCYAEGNAPNMILGYALNTTDDTTMYILKSLARKSEVQVANTFAVAELVE